jgi:hypothetical protein
MADAREPRHVAAEFGRDHLGRSARSAENRVEPGECVGICRGEPLDVAIGRRDGVVEELDMAQAVVEHEAVVGRGAPGERLPQGRALPAHPPLGQLGEGLGGMVPGDQRLEHRRADTVLRCRRASHLLSVVRVEVELIFRDAERSPVRLRLVIGEA